MSGRSTKPTRRRFLVVAGEGVILAGCAGGSDSTEPVDTPEETADGADPKTTSSPTTESPTETDTETETETTSESGEASIAIVDDELVVEESDYSTDYYVATAVENEGDGASGSIELTADWYDSDGNYLDNDSAYLQSLGAGEKWTARIYALATEDIEDYEIDGEFSVSPPDFDVEGLDLGESEMQVGENEAVIRGRVANNTGEEVSYIQAVGKVYNSDGAVLGDDWTNVTDVPADETWSFEVSWRGRDRLEDAANHTVLITDSAF